MSEQPPSPCTGTCTLDPFTRLCRGCARTIEEIMAWPAATAAEKQDILAAVAQRGKLAGQAKPA